MDIELPGYRLGAPLRTTAGGGDAVPTAGGPSAVWSGVRIADGQPVALKVFHPADAGRASREAALTAAVDHPHVLPVLEVVTGPGVVALVTPLASGGDLAALIGARLRLRWAEALTVLIPLADALAAAHERGIVHGDLSAANVVFDSDGRPLLGDLGAARAASELGGPVAATPTDVAPEIARGAAPSPEADLFSLGSVALRCLSGAPAWPAADLQDVLIESAAGQWPDPDDLLGPPQLLAIVRRLLDPEPERRGSAARAAVELRRVGVPEPVELIEHQPDGTVTGPAPATEIRQDALRPPSATGSRRTRRSRRSRRRLHRRGGRHHSDQVRRRIMGPTAERAPSGGGRSRVGAQRRWWRAGLVLAVVVLLGAGAVSAGLWWAGWGATDPTEVVAAPVTGPRVPKGSAVLPDLEPRSGMSGPSGPASSPSSAGPSDAVARPSPSPRPSTSSPPPPSRVRASADAVSDADWLAVVSALDSARAAALTSRDPALLDDVYTPRAPARAADAGRIAAMTRAGHHVDAAAHHVDSVTVAGLGSGGIVWVRVVESQPSYPVLDATGTVVGATKASPHSTVVMQLAPTPVGFRIDRVQRG